MDLGTQYYSQGKFDDALAAFRKATELEPGRIKAWENLGWAHYKTGQLGEALKVWDIVLKIDPRNQEILNATGSTLMAMKQSKEAILRFRSSLILNT
ncbi:MAG: tetratricopeptide repeat protein, partial [Nitrospinales bacterium]